MTKSKLDHDIGIYIILAITYFILLYLIVSVDNLNDKLKDQPHWECWNETIILNSTEVLQYGEFGIEGLNNVCVKGDYETKCINYYHKEKCDWVTPDGRKLG